MEIHTFYPCNGFPLKIIVSQNWIKGQSVWQTIRIGNSSSETVMWYFLKPKLLYSAWQWAVFMQKKKAVIWERMWYQMRVQEISTSVSKVNNLVRFTWEFTYQKIKISLKRIFTEKMDEVWINCSYWVRKQGVRWALTALRKECILPGRGLRTYKGKAGIALYANHLNNEKTESLKH